ncbi:hypothetical protein BpHYR1_006309 [Brachionus plicatilis]|uniref:Uncharacterized protein n=1 Tax=Brachionus plicatilis TaxID=10195 RepID=A0A3M7RMG7_BRAPC|nr:hypothetical protein BpHYR1_006309 [Brachionus plicatilis]
MPFKLNAPGFLGVHLNEYLLLVKFQLFVEKFFLLRTIKALTNVNALFFNNQGNKICFGFEPLELRCQKNRLI